MKSFFSQTIHLSTQERLKHAPARERTANAVQRIIDKSMTRLTITEQNINSRASDLTKPEAVAQMKESVTKVKQSMSNLNFGRVSRCRKFPRIIFVAQRFCRADSAFVHVQAICCE